MISTRHHNNFIPLSDSWFTVPFVTDGFLTLVVFTVKIGRVVLTSFTCEVVIEVINDFVGIIARSRQRYKKKNNRYYARFIFQLP